jgi:hypothetical protein
MRQEGIPRSAKAPGKLGWTPIFEGPGNAIGASPPKVL